MYGVKSLLGDHNLSASRGDVSNSPPYVTMQFVHHSRTGKEAHIFIVFSSLLTCRFLSYIVSCFLSLCRLSCYSTPY